MPENLVVGRCSDTDHTTCSEERIRSHHHAYTRRLLPPGTAWLHDSEGVEPCGLSGTDHAARGDHFTKAARTSGMDLRHWPGLRFAKGSAVRQPGCQVCPRESDARSCDSRERA